AIVSSSVKMSVVREAIQSLNWQPGLHTPVSRAVTRDFGWNEEGDAYLIPGGRITSNGFQAASSHELQVELSETEKACRLDLKHLVGTELTDLKRHIVEHFLKIHDARVTYSLLGTVALAPLARFVEGCYRYLLWLQGPTGTGKSFGAQLAQNFFGSFPGS